MAKPPIRPLTRRKPPPPTGDKMMLGLWWVVGLILLAVVSTFALPTIVILIIGMLPAWVAFIVDPNPSKAAGKCVLSLNLVGIAPYLMDLWVMGGRGQMDKAYVIFTDPFTWLIMYGSAAVGWMIYLGMPHLIGAFMDMRAEHRKAQLITLREEILKEWGEDISGAMQQRRGD